MKELTIEEKAKAYDEALENMRKFRDALSNHDETDLWVPREDIVTDIEYYFPELKDTEDERIRKNCIHFLDLQKSHHASTLEIDECIAWLEKLGEQKVSYTTIVETGNGGINTLVTRELPVDGCDDKQKSANTVEPKDYSSIDPYFGKPIDKVKSKFKVGDWISCEGLNIARIINIDNDRYEVEFIEGNKGFPHIDYIDRLFHLWTIEEAKDGDILTESRKNIILMFRAIGNIRWDDVIDYHCYYKCYGEKFIVQKDLDYWGTTNDNQLKPATKEQRDTLERVIANAGYKWNKEKLKLEKI
jgi:hypothetical protein